MRYLFDNWTEIANRITIAPKVLILFDYDGTLTEIVESPEMAIFDERRQGLLRTLSEKPRFSVAVVSGRALADIKERIGLRRIIFAGNHGLEIQGPDFRFIHPLNEELRATLRIINSMLTRTLRNIRGVRVEDKGLTISLHYRGALREDQENITNGFEKVVGMARLAGFVKTTFGKKVYEVRPNVPWDKGKATRLIMKRRGRGGRRSRMMPIYLGDDRTDEDAFKVVESYGGISIHIGEETDSSCAGYYLNSPSEVYEFIGRLGELS